MLHSIVYVAFSFFSCSRSSHSYNCTATTSRRAHNYGMSPPPHPHPHHDLYPVVPSVNLQPTKCGRCARLFRLFFVLRNLFMLLFFRRAYILLYIITIPLYTLKRYNKNITGQILLSLVCVQCQCRQIFPFLRIGLQHRRCCVASCIL